MSPTSQPRDPRWIAIARHGTGYRASVSQGRDRPPIRRHFPPGTKPETMQAWRADMQAQFRVTRKTRATAGTFEHDARRYLRAVTALTTYHTRVKDIERWIAIFGRRRRDTITAADIREWRDRWIEEPRGKDAQGRPLPPYAASTINHWLRALSNLWTVLDGRRAPNPVREVPEVPEPDALPRALTYAMIELIIAAVTDRGRPVRGQPNKGTVSLTKLRLRVLAYTGLTYAQLGRMQPSDVDLTRGTMLVRRRQKGKGAKPRLLPLLPEAVDAFRAFAAADAWGPFSGASVRKSFVLAAAKVRQDHPELPAVRPYDLRHSLGTLVFRVTGSREAVRELLSHENLRTTARYTLDAVHDVLSQQLEKMSATFASTQNVDPDGK